MSENAMWKDDVDALQDVNKDEVAKSEGAADSSDAAAAGEGKEAADARKTGQHQKVIVDAWGRPLIYLLISIYIYIIILYNQIIGDCGRVGAASKSLAHIPRLP